MTNMPKNIFPSLDALVATAQIKNLVKVGQWARRSLSILYIYSIHEYRLYIIYKEMFFDFIYIYYLIIYENKQKKIRLHKSLIS